MTEGELVDTCDDINFHTEYSNEDHDMFLECERVLSRTTEFHVNLQARRQAQQGNAYSQCA